MTTEVREVGTRAEEIAYFERWAMILGNPPTRDWIDGIKSELETLKNLPFRIGDRSSDPAIDAVLESCGLRLPTDAKEQYECFLAVKTVVHWVERKLKELEENAEWHRKLLEREREGADDG